MSHLIEIKSGGIVVDANSLLTYRKKQGLSDGYKLYDAKPLDDLSNTWWSHLSSNDKSILNHLQERHHALSLLRKVSSIVSVASLTSDMRVDADIREFLGETLKEVEA